jgi:hypothetical protein
MAGMVTTGPACETRIPQRQRDRLHRHWLAVALWLGWSGASSPPGQCLGIVPALPYSIDTMTLLLLCACSFEDLEEP